MTVKNSMQLKARVKKIAQEKRITSQLVLQNYMQERFLERIYKTTSSIRYSNFNIIWNTKPLKCINSNCLFNI